jgi:hypothetical protein
MTSLPRFIRERLLQNRDIPGRDCPDHRELETLVHLVSAAPEPTIFLLHDLSPRSSTS